MTLSPLRIVQRVVPSIALILPLSACSDDEKGGENSGDANESSEDTECAEDTDGADDTGSSTDEEDGCNDEDEHDRFSGIEGGTCDV